MALDLDRKKVVKNNWRVTKVRGESALRIRVPGGHLEVKHFDLIKQIADTYGNGTVHITTRQGFELPGIAYEKIPEINRLIYPILHDLELAIGVKIDQPELGYPAAGTRNVAACIGNRVCPFANFDTTVLAKKIEKEIYPNNLHVKIALTGCPNDCIKARMHDFGIIGVTEPVYDYNRCIGCEACVKNCKKKVTGALAMHNGKVIRDQRRCIGCGECVLQCPTSAWTRHPEKYFNLTIMGRTGKKNPRIGELFIQWATAEVVVAVIKNTYKYVEQHIDKSLVKEHIGYIVDRTGYQQFRDMVLSGIELNTKARVAKNIQWAGHFYASDIFMSE